MKTKKEVQEKQTKKAENMPENNQTAGKGSPSPLDSMTGKKTLQLVKVILQKQAKQMKDNPLVNSLGYKQNRVPIHTGIDIKDNGDKRFLLKDLIKHARADAGIIAKAIRQGDGKLFHVDASGVDIEDETELREDLSALYEARRENLNVPAPVKCKIYIRDIDLPKPKKNKSNSRGLETAPGWSNFEELTELVKGLDDVEEGDEQQVLEQEGQVDNDTDDADTD